MQNATLGALPTASDEAVVALSNLADSVHGLSDLGYKHARTREAASQLAMRAAEMMLGFPDNVSDEDKNLVFEGYRLRKGELLGARYYKREGKDTFYLSSQQDYTADPDNHVRIDVGFAFSYSQQQYGALRKERPNYHALIGEVRKDTAKYCSNAWNALVATYKAMTREPRAREANATFFKYLDDTFEAMMKRLAVARNRENGNVPSDAALKKAITAFRKALD